MSVGKKSGNIISVRGTLIIVALLNLAYFFIELFAAIKINSVSLFADSIDFLEDTFVNLLILFSFLISSTLRPKLSKILVIVILLPGLTALWAAWEQIVRPLPPEAFKLTLVGFGALLTNITCTIILMKFRKNNKSITKAAFLSARSDLFSNFTIIIAGLIIMIHPSIWPDLIAAVLIFSINFDAAYKVYKIANTEDKKHFKNRCL
ncbi:MAG: cobalt transporter [Rickettsiales bacterium]|nr:cobalt transporter [Rickettsiales bacterium]RPG13295.1 MAG: cation transporter [Pelagibacteraceae bacterium TMED195]